MKNLSISFLLLGLIACGGCTSNDFSQKQAKALAAKVAAYTQEQSDRVDRLNASFNNAYQKLVQSLDTTSSSQLLVDRNEEAQRIADGMIASSNSTLRQTFRDTFLKSEQADRQAMDAADQAIAAATASYQKSYKALSIPLSTLKKAQQDLTSLSEDPVTSSKIASTMQMIYSAYQSVSTSTQQSKNALTPKTTTTTTTKTK